MLHVIGLNGAYGPPEEAINARKQSSVPWGQSCFAFAGSRGRLTVQLVKPVIVTHVTVEQRR